MNYQVSLFLQFSFKYNIKDDYAKVNIDRDIEIMFKMIQRRVNQGSLKNMSKWITLNLRTRLYIIDETMN